jgi:hypothetical protein
MLLIEFAGIGFRILRQPTTHLKLDATSEPVTPAKLILNEVFVDAIIQSAALRSNRILIRIFVDV